MLIIENSYNHKCSLGSLTSITRQSLNNMLESQVLILESTLLMSKLHLSCTVAVVLKLVALESTYVPTIMLPNACYNSYYLYA